MRNRWLSPRALLLHVAVVVLATSCLIAAWWQMGRARSGVLLSYAYALQWPLFAGVAVVGWWILIHDDDPEVIRARRADREASLTADRVAPRRTRRVEEESEELRRYNDYLETRARSSEPKTWRNSRRA